jgi:hypothetical protein
LRAFVHLFFHEHQFAFERIDFERLRAYDAVLLDNVALKPCEAFFNAGNPCFDVHDGRELTPK